MSSFNWSLELPLIEEPDPLADDGKREIHEHPPRIVTRDDWDADDVESEDEERLEDIDDFPIPYIVLTHTRTRPCYDKDDCKLAVKEMQRKHLEEGEPDIRYNFLIDTEGFIYIGRGPAIHHGIEFPEDNEKMKKTYRKSIIIGYIGNGGIEPPEELVFGSASLISLLMDGKYIDEEVDYVWFHQPVRGLEGENPPRPDYEAMVEMGETERAASMFLKEAEEMAAADAII